MKTITVKHSASDPIETLIEARMSVARVQLLNELVDDIDSSWTSADVLQWVKVKLAEV